MSYGGLCEPMQDILHGLNVLHNPKFGINDYNMRLVKHKILF